MGLLNRKKTKVDEPEKKIEEVVPASLVSTDDKLSGTIKSGRIIIKPLVTEKSAVAQSQNKYSFMVDRRAGKLDIKKAIKEIFGIEPITVNVMNIEGKIRRFGRTKGRRQDYKKAVVTLPKGKSISVHEGV